MTIIYDLEAEAITLQQEIEVQERQNENIEKFIQKAHKYVGIEELDGYALRELVSAIYVDAPAGIHPAGRANEKGNGVTEVTPPPENTRFSPFFDFYCFMTTRQCAGRFICGRGITHVHRNMP